MPLPPPRKRSAPPSRWMFDQMRKSGGQRDLVTVAPVTARRTAPVLKKAKQSSVAEGRHYALVNVGKLPPSKRRQCRQFEPHLIDSTKFLVDPIRPYPEWPLICKQENRAAFDNEKAGKAWLEKHSPSVSVFRAWLCDFCGKHHLECTPHEVSGTTSGKSIRKDAFLRSKGIEPE